MLQLPALRIEVERLVAAYQQRADPALSLVLFRALGWDGGGNRVEPGRKTVAGTPYRLIVSGETTAYLFVTPDGLGQAAVDNAVNVAYNSGVDWAAVTN